MHALTPAQRRALAAVARITLVVGPVAACSSGDDSIPADVTTPDTSTTSEAGEIVGDGDLGGPDATFGDTDPSEVEAATSTVVDSGEDGIDYVPDGATVSGACGTFDPANPTPDVLSCCSELAASKVDVDGSHWTLIDRDDPTQVACCYVVSMGVRDQTILLFADEAGTANVPYAALSNCCAIFDPPPYGGACLSWGPPMPVPLDERAVA